MPRVLLAADAAAAALHRAAQLDHAALGTRHAAVHEHQMLFRNDLRHALAEHADALVAVLTGHAHAELGATRRHVRTDRTAVTTILVRTVRLHRARELVAPDDAREAAADGDARDVQQLPGLEHLVQLELLPDLLGGGVLGVATELALGALRFEVLALESAAHRLRLVLLLHRVDAQDERVVAVLVTRPLA